MRTSAVANAPLTVVTTVAVLLEGDFYPSAAVAAVIKLCVGVERDEWQWLAVIVSGSVAGQAATSERNPHCIEVGDESFLCPTCKKITSCLNLNLRMMKKRPN